MLAAKLGLRFCGSAIAYVCFIAQKLAELIN